MGQIIEGVEALDFNPDLVVENVSVDSSRAVKVSTLFVDKITTLYGKKVSNITKVEEEPVEEPVDESTVEEYEEPFYTGVPEVEEQEEPIYEVPEEVSSYEEPVVMPIEIELPPIVDPDGMLSDIASSFEVAVKQIHEKQAEVEAKELEIEKIQADLVTKQEKTDNLLEELEKMKKEAEVSKKDAEKIIREAEAQEKILQKRVAAFEVEREKFLNNLKVTTGSIMNMFDKKN